MSSKDADGSGADYSSGGDASILRDSSDLSPPSAGGADVLDISAVLTSCVDVHRSQEDEGPSTEEGVVDLLDDEEIENILEGDISDNNVDEDTPDTPDR